MEELPKRKSTRMQGFDYNQTGMFFVTICTKDRRCLLSEIVGTEVPDRPSIKLTEYGQIAEKYIRQLDEFYEHISVHSHVIMPNHIHIMFSIEKSGQSGIHASTRANSDFSQFVSTFKRFCNKEYGENIWQARSHDRIIRNRLDYEEHMRYIQENPICWYYDELYPEE